jgi:hypothetical protein
MKNIKCPFNIGDCVVYTPSTRGRNLLVMSVFADLVPGQRYEIVKIENDAYVFVRGFEEVPEGGLHWTEFSAG